VWALAGEIDKPLLAGAMHLAHRRFERACPAAIPLTKLAVGIPARVLGAIFQPQQRERHARFLELLVERGPLRDHPIPGGWDGGPRKQPRLQGRIIEILGERPLQARGRRALQIRGDRAQPHGTGPRDCAVAETGFILQAEQFAESSHQ
jgi:hypothetical protein